MVYPNPLYCEEEIQDKENPPNGRTNQDIKQDRELRDTHLTLNDTERTGNELTKLHDMYKTAIKTTNDYKKQLIVEMSQQTETNWEFEHQTKRRTIYEAQDAKMTQDVTALRYSSPMIGGNRSIVTICTSIMDSSQSQSDPEEEMSFEKKISQDFSTDGYSGSRHQTFGRGAKAKHDYLLAPDSAATPLIIEMNHLRNYSNVIKAKVDAQTQLQKQRTNHMALKMQVKGAEGHH
ncbi:hypothetical protein GBF38_000906 [Nibea albiflora]|nr:hypothetical protein GBF38_000906 [Nibea albiflora]